MDVEKLKANISDILRNKADRHGYVVIPDEFGIGGYMISVGRLERFLSPLLDAAKPESDNGAMSPKDFAMKMEALSVQDTDTEETHVNMDNLMCDTLKALGYGDGVRIFDETYKWYA